MLADRHATARIPPGWARAAWETDPDATVAAGVDDVIGTATSSDENEPAVIIFTSGTSGRPKAVVLSHRALLANLQMLLHMTRKLPHQLNDTSADVALHTGPLFHIGGAQGMMRGLTVGNTLVLPGGRFDPGEALALIEQWKITRWAAVPTMVSRVLEHPDVHRRNLRSLRAVTLGGAPLHVELQQRIRDGLPGVNARIATGYGLSENGGQATAASDADTIERPGTSGRPLPLTEIKIGRSCRVARWRDLHPGANADVRLLRFGRHRRLMTTAGSARAISAAMDEAGYIWITGRCKDLIIRGGENVAPAAVEQALVAAPGVRDAVVFGLSHPDLGEEVAAVIVVDEGYRTCGDRGARANACGVLRRSHVVAVPDRAAAGESNREGRQAGGGGAGARGTRRAESLVVANASFRHLAPASRIFYGDDCLKHLPAELARVGAERAVVFCGRTLAQATPGLATVQAALGPLCAGVFAGVVEQSPLAAVEDGVEELRRLNADAVIALGGGSAVVTARAATVLYGEGKNRPRPLLPCSRPADRR